MIEISFWQVFAVITAVWVLLRVLFALKNGRINWKRELMLLTVYCCIIVITRMVYFPLRPVDGQMGKLIFDSSRILPFWIDPIPFVNLFERYNGWLMNIAGNILMFVPVGFFWPLCFKKLDNPGKATAAGALYSLLIELSQLLFYQRKTDANDIVTNTLGAFIGALLYFGCAALVRRKRK